MGPSSHAPLMRTFLAAATVAAGEAFQHAPFMGLSRGHVALSMSKTQGGAGILGHSLGGHGQGRRAGVSGIHSRPCILPAGSAGGCEKTLARLTSGGGKGEGERSWELLDQLCADTRVRRVAAWTLFAAVRRSARLHMVSVTPILHISMLT